MMLSRALTLAFVLAVLPLAPAAAQSDAVPGSPMEPGKSLPECQQLLVLRDETAKHAKALQAVDRKNAPPREVCRVFQDLVAAESAMIKGLEQHGSSCSVPTGAIEQVKSGHGKSTQIAKQVCAAAAQTPRPPTLSTGDFWTPNELRRLFEP
jgi:hypothetical protein